MAVPPDLVTEDMIRQAAIRVAIQLNEEFPDPTHVSAVILALTVALLTTLPPARREGAVDGLFDLIRKHLRLPVAGVPASKGVH